MASGLTLSTHITSPAASAAESLYAVNALPSVGMTVSLTRDVFEKPAHALSLSAQNEMDPPRSRCD